MRLFRGRSGIRLLEFRKGLNVVCRQGTRDWDVVHELLFAGSYNRALKYLHSQPGTPRVLDLGGNIGLFSLLAASSNQQASVVAFEPGPPNYRFFEMNRLANPFLADRIALRKQAVGGVARTTEWFFDEGNPGGSGLFGASGSHFPVQIVTFEAVVDSIQEPISLVKIDIEGAEYEILLKTPAATWQRIQAISLELHEDPAHLMSNTEFLKRLQGYGFALEQESVCAYFLSRGKSGFRSED